MIPRTKNYEYRIRSAWKSGQYSLVIGNGQMKLLNNSLKYLFLPKTLKILSLEKVICNHAVVFSYIFNGRNIYIFPPELVNLNSNEEAVSSLLFLSFMADLWFLLFLNLLLLYPYFKATLHHPGSKTS